VALYRLAEQDPLIGVRHDARTGELALSLYGEVQKEVIAATLLEEHGVPARFAESTTLHIERPAGTGEAVELIGTERNPFLATVGLRVEPAPEGSGIAFRLEVELGSMPLSYFTAVEESVAATLAAGGLHGWRVEDARVSMTHSGYWAKQSSGHAAFDKSMSSTARDFRDLTPVVLLRALAAAGTVVCEPVHRFRVEAPADALGQLLPALGALRGVPDPPELAGDDCVITGELPAAAVHGLRTRLPTLTRGEGLLETVFARYSAVRGSAPANRRVPSPETGRRGR
jgi:ribosomal protection tetracycline resistance protein